MQRLNLDMSLTENKSSKSKEFGPWSEQSSSSGKRYYYNRVTEVSQWEKPSEWRHAEKDLKRKRSRSKTRRNDKSPNERHSQSSSNPNPAKKVVTDIPQPSGSDHPINNSNAIASKSETEHQNASTFHDEKYTKHRYEIASHRRKPSDWRHPEKELERKRSRSRTRMNDKSPNERHSQSQPSSNPAKKVIITDIPQPSGSDHPINNSNAIASKSETEHQNTSTFNDEKYTKHRYEIASHRRKPSDWRHPEKELERKRSRSRTRMNDKSPNERYNQASSNPNPAKKVVADLPQPPVSDLPINDCNVIASKSETEHQNASIFQEEKYIKHYRYELASHRRNWSSDNYLNEAKKYAERRFKQDKYIGSIDTDLKSVRSLIRAAELRTTMIKLKLSTIRQQINNLEILNK